MFSNQLVAINRLFHKTTFLTQKHSPEILTAAGILGGITAAVMAVKATPKLTPVVDELETDLEDVSAMVEASYYSENSNPDLQIAKDKAAVYAKATKAAFVIYAPSVTLGLLSVSSILAAHGILRKRNLVLLAAYKSLETSFSDYRGRVVEADGAEADRGFASGEVSEVTDGEGVVKATPATANPYIRYFDEGSIEWTKTAEYNKQFLMTAQSMFNDLLQARGHVFLNEVLERLGFEHCAVGAITGWTLNGDGDGYIDFGFNNLDSDRVRAFLTGSERYVRLEFNVDGPIWDLI